jgi:hypothetical protein
MRIFHRWPTTLSTAGPDFLKTRQNPIARSSLKYVLGQWKKDVLFLPDVSSEMLKQCRAGPNDSLMVSRFHCMPKASYVAFLFLMFSQHAVYRNTAAAEVLAKLGK